MSEALREPKAGDQYYQQMEEDLDDSGGTGFFLPMTIVSVDERYTDDDDGRPAWGITADDGTGYDCQWSERHQCWCYSLTPKEA